MDERFYLIFFCQHKFIAFFVYIFVFCIDIPGCQHVDRCGGYIANENGKTLVVKIPKLNFGNVCILFYDKSVTDTNL